MSRCFSMTNRIFCETKDFCCFSFLPNIFGLYGYSFGIKRLAWDNMKSFNYFSIIWTIFCFEYYLAKYRPNIGRF